MAKKKKRGGYIRSLFISLILALAIVAIGFMIIRIRPPKQTIAMVTPDVTLIGIGTETQLYVNVLPGGSLDEPLRWTSSNEKIVSVDPSGKIVSTGTGNAIITATAGKDLRADCSVRVIIQPQFFGIREENVVSFLGEEKTQLTYSILPENANDYTVEWYSSDENVVKVDENGYLTAVGVGSAGITAVTTNGLADTCYVECKYPVKSIKLDRTELTISDMDPVQLTAELEIANYPADDTVVWESSDPGVAYVTDTGVVRAISNGQAVITAAARGSVGKKAECAVTVSNYNGKVVALTFDDGPCRVSLDICHILDDYGAKATFFVVGDQVRSYPNVLRDIYTFGNEIGNHTDDHVSLYTDTFALAQARIIACDDAVKELIGEVPTVLRAPGGSINAERIAGINDYRYFVHWTLDSGDWETQNAEMIYNNVMKNVKDRSIILMHDIYPETAQALEKILPKLKEQGYRFVTISELMTITGTGDSMFYNP